MSYTKRNRGKEASDDRLFGTTIMHNKLKEAATDMCYLLTKGYAEKSAVQLVGHRYRLNSRQIKVLQGMSASKQAIDIRQKRAISPNDLNNKIVIIDGFNLLIILESALSGAYLFKGLDGYYRDISSVHGTYKRVQKTEEALILIGKILGNLQIKKALWYFDSPVSNSGRLKALLYEIAIKYNFAWDIYLDHNPDKIIATSEHIAISADAWILNQVKHNCNLGAYLIENYITDPLIVFSS